MKIKKKFNHNILKINKNELLLINKYELSAILQILKNDKKQYFIEKKNDFTYQKTKSTKSLKKHHDESLQNYSNVFKILQFLR